MKKTYVVAIAILVIAGLLGSFVGQMTTIPTYVRDPLYRAQVATELAHPGFDILGIREYNGVIEIYLAPHAIPNAQVRAFFGTLFEYLAPLIPDEMAEIRIFMNFKVGNHWIMEGLFRGSQLNLRNKGLVIEAFVVDQWFSFMCSMFPMTPPIRPLYEGPPSILK